MLCTSPDRGPLQVPEQRMRFKRPSLGSEGDDNWCGQVTWGATLPVCSLCGFEDKCLKCAPCRGNFTGACASCYHRHPWSADQTQEALTSHADALPCLNACDKAKCPAGPQPMPAVAPPPPGVIYGGALTVCASDDCSKGAAEWKMEDGRTVFSDSAYAVHRQGRRT